MLKALHIFRRATVLLLAVVWFQTTAHLVVCHRDSALCGQDGCEESAVCTCHGHAAIEPVAEVSFHIGQPVSVLVPATDETIRALLLPDDIFRPPLTNG